MCIRDGLLGAWDRCRPPPRASPDTFARRPSWRPMFDDQSSGRRGQRSAHGPRARGGCGVCLARRRGRVNSRRSSRSADLERRAGPPLGPAGAPYGPRGAREAYRCGFFCLCLSVHVMDRPWEAFDRARRVLRGRDDLAGGKSADLPSVGATNSARRGGKDRRALDQGGLGECEWRDTCGSDVPCQASRRAAPVWL